ncbi:uncharacterized protein BX663DRAFT_466022 [Cokeromyces recurvatus]|uniref:uncharacterized protein n=1 Tax=Cokeromyces recurvatus TaxID=90255 RepID=UPI00221EB6AC|nr:uncharacterized protein BX663DRAFT_466022 [Cokeromyces recurvatus]KAI7907387.1 hypothetical protein BX663DRAFT_466022 [Cokeromyces recurvatus]
MSVSTLYTICFNYIKNHTKDISSLEGIPFSPVVESLLDFLFKSKIPLNSSILSIISQSHAQELRKADLDWTYLNLSQAFTISAIASLKTVSDCFPKFITCLNLSNCHIQDTHIPLLRAFINLKILDLTDNVDITDHTMIHIANMATHNIINKDTFIGLPFLEEIYLTRLPLITDKSLKYIPKVTNLLFIDLSYTNVIQEVACHYLSIKGFKRISSLRENKVACYQTKIRQNPKLHEFIKEITVVDFADGDSKQWQRQIKPTQQQIAKSENRHYLLCFARDEVKYNSAPSLSMTNNRKASTQQRQLEGIMNSRKVIVKNENWI